MTSPVHASADLVCRAAEATALIRAETGEPPPVALVLGSGMGGLAKDMQNRRVIPYARIPHFPVPTVPGHDGNLVCGTLGGVRLIVLQGRSHYYEGHSLETVTFPVRVLQFLNVRTLILTAAAGGIRSDLPPGSVVSVSDHLNLIGANPLRGLHDDRLGPRFLDVTEVYSKRLRGLASEEAQRLGLDLSSGVYACLPGPSYETPAEIRMLRALGADVVGMSTVPEAIVARQAGMEVLALALVTNAAAGVIGTPISHEEVLEAGRRTTPLLEKLIQRVVLRLSVTRTELEIRMIREADPTNAQVGILWRSRSTSARTS
ncbi:MAG: purine-nucleoside phosphorylase [Planctomycetaceae bacterium]|nr:purine-nucleoside phosphorylase [Planctomycetaceae bacterium]